jgi:hypothetical protein
MPPTRWRTVGDAWACLEPAGAAQASAEERGPGLGDLMARDQSIGVEVEARRILPIPNPNWEDDHVSILDRYLAYADAFELSYADDDWTRLEAYFAPGAVYEGAPPARGRDAVLAKLKSGVDAFDRRMDSRTPDFAAPTVKGNTLQMKWKVTYTKKDLPNLVISGVEIAEFDGDRIALLRDEFDPAAEKAMGEWMAKHAKALQPR